jgi:NosR/NirI family nitrous oxide reductase transcriptional regulator
MIMRWRGGARAAAMGLRALAVAIAVAGITSAQPAAEDDPWGFDDLEDAEPAFLELATQQAPDILLFVAFATLAMVSFFRKSMPLKYLTLVASVVYMGVYKSQLMSIVNVFSTLTGNLPIFSYSMGWYVFAIFTAVTTLLWGRLYCGRICAFGALTQLLDSIVPKRFQLEVPSGLERRAGYIKYGILFGAVGYYLLTREISFYRYIEPFWMFTFEASTALWIGLGALLVASVFIRNLYCRFLCPLGAALGLVSSVTSVFKIKRWSECSTCQLCEKTCEWGAIRQRKIIMSECVRCDDCERLYADQRACPHWLLKFKREARAAAEARATRSARPESTAGRS